MISSVRVCAIFPGTLFLVLAVTPVHAVLQDREENHDYDSLKLHEKTHGVRVTPPSNPLAGKTWTGLGPGNIGSNISDMAFINNEIWVTSTMGGLWRTKDQKAWENRSGDLTSKTNLKTLALGSILVDPSDSKHVFVGTGTWYPKAFAGHGVYETTNIQATNIAWTAVGDTSRYAHIYTMHMASDGALLLGTNDGIKRYVKENKVWVLKNSAFPNIRVNNFSAHPKYPDKIVAGGVDWGAKNSWIWYSENGGTSWTRTTLQDEHGTSVTPALEFTFPTFAKKQTSNIAYAGAGAFLYKSIDYGKTFKKVTSNITPFPFVVWAGDPNDDQLVVIAATWGSHYRSTDGGATMKIISRPWPNSRHTPIDKASAIAGSPEAGINDEAVLDFDSMKQNGEMYSFIGPKFPYHVHEFGEKYWDLITDAERAQLKPSIQTELNRLQGNCVHSDIHLLRSPDGTKLYSGNDGGLYVTDNIKATGMPTWKEAFESGFDANMFYSGGGSPFSGVLLGGTQDQNVLAYLPSEGRDKWIKMLGGDGGRVTRDPFVDNIFYAMEMSWKLEPYRLEIDLDSGDLSCIRIHDGINDWHRGANNAKGTYDASFRAPLVVDPNTSHRLYTGGASLWRTNNPRAYMPDWVEIKSPLTTDHKTTSSISSVAVAPGDPDFVVVGYDDGSIFKTRSSYSADRAAMGEWDDIGIPTTIAPKAGPVLDIHIDRSKRITLIRGNKIFYKNLNGSWTQTANLPSDHGTLYSLAVDPVDSNRLYVGTWQGVYASPDLGGHWWRTNVEIGPVPVLQLFWQRFKLVAATFGRGMFEVDVSDKMMNDTIQNLGPDLVGYHAFDSDTYDPVNAYFARPLLNNATIDDLTTPRVPFTPDYVNGKVGKALAFNQQNTYLQLSDDLKVAGGKYSFSVWISLNSYGGAAHVTTHSAFRLIDRLEYLKDWDQVGFPYKSGTLQYSIESQSIYSTARLPDDGTWHHVVVTVDYETMTCRFYFDGKPDTVADLTEPLKSVEKAFRGGFPLEPWIGGWGIGAKGSILTIDGSVDEVAFFKKTLSASDVRHIYSLGMNGHSLLK